MNNAPGPAAVHALFENAEFVQAYASALRLFVQQPDDYELGLLFLRTAIFIERADSVIAVLHDVAARVPQQSLHLLLFQAHLCCMHFPLAWQHLHQAGLAKDSVAFHDCAFRIAFQEQDLSAALNHLLAKERQVDCPLAHFLKKFEIWKLQGRYAEIRHQISVLEAHIAPDARLPRAQLQLWRAGIAHNEHKFALSLEITEQFIRSYLAAPLLAAGDGRKKFKSWTRRRQHQVIQDLERLTLLHELPLFMVAGSLLSLVREGDFFLSDKDLDLGLLDGNLEQVAQLLINSGCFDDISPPDYFVGYKQLRHRATGFVVDITQYETRNGQIYALWAHTSGEILRQTVFARFALREAFFPSLSCRVLIPDQSDSYLTSMYGDWRTPDPHFDTVIAACNLCELTPFLLSLGFIKIADALLNRQQQKLMSSIKHLHDHGFQSPLLTQIQKANP